MKQNVWLPELAMAGQPKQFAWLKTKNTMRAVCVNVTENKMHEPYLALYIEDGTLHIAKKLPTEDVARGIIEVPIEQVTSDTFDEAAKKLGGTVLGLFKLWHKKTFEGWDDSIRFGAWLY